MENNYKIYGGKLCIFGDMHLSSTYTGTHKDYMSECYYTMSKIIDIVKGSTPSAVFFLGDVIGVNERNLKDRKFLMDVILFFHKLNTYTGGNVFSVKGNHDKGAFSDFDLFVGLGLIKNPDYVDYYNTAEIAKDLNLEVRFHFVNYGEEGRKLMIPEEKDYSNVVLGHNDYLIDGVTNWYQHKGGVHISRLNNFIGVDMIISGHIHNPSSEVYSTFIGGNEDNEIALFYPGSPARTSERYNDCWYVTFYYDGESTQYDVELLGLKPADEVFYEKVELLDENDSDVDSMSLTNIVKEIIEGRITSGDLFSQVRSVPGASDEVKDIACKYLQKAIDDEN